MPRRNRVNAYLKRGMARQAELGISIAALSQAMLDGELTSEALRSGFPWPEFNVRRAWRLLYVAQAGRCSLCDEFMLPIGALGRGWQEGHVITQDHVVPRSKGGGGRDCRNILLAHNSCNLAKGGREPNEAEIRHAALIWQRVASAEGVEP